MRRSQNLTDIVLLVGVPGDQVSVSGSGAHKSVIKSCIELCLTCLCYTVWFGSYFEQPKFIFIGTQNQTLFPGAQEIHEQNLEATPVL